MSFEISNITFVPLLNFMKHKGLDEQLLFQGCDVDLSYIRKLSKRSSWDLYNIALNNIEEYVDDDWAYIARQGVVAPELDQLRSLFSGIVSSRFIYWAQSKFIGNYLFNNFTYTYEKINQSHVKIIIDVGRSNVHEGIMKIYHQVFELFPIQLGQPNAKVDMTKISSREYLFDIKLSKRINIFKRGLLLFKIFDGMKNATHYLSELQETKNKLELALMEVEKAKLEREQWLKVIAHDIRNPLQIILGYFALIKRNRSLDSKKRDNYIEKITIACDIIDKCTMNAQKVIKLDNDSFKPQVISTTEVISKSISIVEGFAEEKNIELINECEEHFILGDLDIFSLSIITNFLTNAIKFSNRNSSINIGTVTGPDHIAFYIRDYGIGISEPKLKEILQHGGITTTGTNNEKGLGQGLVIARNFITKYHGRLQVESNTEGENRGTLITIFFPKPIKKQEKTFDPLRPTPLSH